jgi:hypothetical protein
MMMIDGRAVRWLQFNSSRRHDDGIRQETASASPSTRTQISRYVWALIKCRGQGRVVRDKVAEKIVNRFMLTPTRQRSESERI